ncbi:MAG: HamA C-terminal domain-containing protein [Oscillospiraceae bacterium]
MQEQPISKTLIDEQFDGVFVEIDHSEDLKLFNPNELRIFCLNLANNAFSFDALQEFLLDNIGSYVFSRAEIDDLKIAGKDRGIDLKALREMNKHGTPDEKGTGNELGEMLIYAFLERVLGAPKLLSKIELTSAGGDCKSDSVHLLSRTDSKGVYHQMVFGTSNIIGDLRDAVDSAFNALQEIKAAGVKELQLVEKTIFNRCFDDETTERIKTIILPSKGVNSIPEPAFGLFLGYTLGLDKTKYPTRQFCDVAEKKMQSDIAKHIDYIIQKINALGMTAYSFYIYVLPLNDAEIDKKAIMSDLLMGGASG